jgi:starch phosphorylase
MALAEMIATEAGSIRSENVNTSIETGQKKVFYFSMEFLIGRLLENYLYNLGVRDVVAEALEEMGDNLEELFEFEPDPGLGNGGLGRLAACFLDSMAAIGIDGAGIGLRYKFGLFRQMIKNGKQIELPDTWLQNDYPWEVKHPEDTVIVRFGGHVERTYIDGVTHFAHKGYQCVYAVPYDVPIVGEGGENVGVLHLFDAQPMRETIDMDAFNRGDYAAAMKERCDIDAMTSILYPDDSNGMGRKLRLRQEYLMVAAGIENIVRNYKALYGTDQWLSFPERISIHINDTHPTLCIPELIRVLLDQENLDWDDAWTITLQTVSFTNHTILPEAMESWPIGMFKELLPRVYMIIEEIDRRFREKMEKRGCADYETLRRTSILWDNMVRMANLSIIGSHSVNGVAALHSEILKNDVFYDFQAIYPNRFNNKTNGVSHRRFMIQSNPALARLITDVIGDEWLRDFNQIEKLLDYKDDFSVTARLRQVKKENKQKLAEYMKKTAGISVNPDSVFDIQVKRIHAYKRQLLNIFKIMDLYNRIKQNPDLDILPYTFAKEVVHLINVVANLVNNDPVVSKKIKVVFVENFCVSNGQLIYPAADISEQISTAGKEASGTGNMKFMMNGAVTLGTLDGANAEILMQVGKENMEIFGLTSEETSRFTMYGGYNAKETAEADLRLKRITSQLVDGTLKDEHIQSIGFWGIYDNLLTRGDEYFVLKDFDAYIKAFENLDRIYRDEGRWGAMSLTNIAKSAFFSSDRTVREYADEIWHVEHR